MILKNLQKLLQQTGVVPITATVEVDYCWACHCIAPEYERHHIVPRCYGGENGPTVVLCGSCHNRVHKEANKVIRQLCMPKDTNERRRYLAIVVALAHHSVKDEKKPVKFSGQLDHPTNQMLEEIARSLNLSKHDSLVWCIKRVYSSMFKASLPIKD